MINVPSAVDAFNLLIEELTNGLAEKFQLIIEPFTQFRADIVAFNELAREPLEPGESRLVRYFQELQNFIDGLNTLVEDVVQATEAAGDVVDLFDRLLTNLESLDALFLQQGNSRTTEPSGHRARIRVGHLHEGNGGGE